MVHLDYKESVLKKLLNLVGVIAAVSSSSCKSHMPPIIDHRLVTKQVLRLELLDNGNVATWERGSQSAIVLEVQTNTAWVAQKELRSKFNLTGKFKLVEGREDIGGLLHPYLKVLTTTGTIIARSTPGSYKVFSMGQDEIGRLHWIEETQDHEWTWVRLDMDKKVIRAHLTATERPHAMSPSGEVIISETAQFADGSYIVRSFGGNIVSLPPLNGTACTAILLDDKTVLAAAGKELSSGDFDYEFVLCRAPYTKWVSLAFALKERERPSPYK